MTNWQQRERGWLSLNLAIRFDMAELARLSPEQSKAIMDGIAACLAAEHGPQPTEISHENNDEQTGEEAGV